MIELERVQRLSSLRHVSPLGMELRIQGGRKRIPGYERDPVVLSSSPEEPLYLLPRSIGFNDLYFDSGSMRPTRTNSFLNTHILEKRRETKSRDADIYRYMYLTMKKYHETRHLIFRISSAKQDLRSHVYFSSYMGKVHFSHEPLTALS